MILQQMQRRALSSNSRAIQRAPHASIVAVASRSSSKAQAFLLDLRLLSCYAYGSYEDLLQDINVDAVYVTLPTSLRKEVRCS